MVALPQFLHNVSGGDDASTKINCNRSYTSTEESNLISEVDSQDELEMAKRQSDFEEKERRTFSLKDLITGKVSRHITNSQKP